MSNKEMVINKLKGTVYKLGCYSERMESIPKEEMNKILDVIL